jgi:predicted homoserine dehydrogenase-like protein
MFDRLRTLAEPVRLSIIGMGAMGKGLFYQAEITEGFRCLAIADIDLQKAIDVASWLRREYRIVGSVSDADQVIRSGILAVCEDGNILAGCEGIDVMIEASSSVLEAGQFCELALKSGKHVSMMNAEADLAFGPYFLALARENGVVYSSCDGDQHGVIKQLMDEMVLWGFEPVMAGNIKGFLDRYSDPVKIIPEADKRKLDYKMAAAYTDGTKLNIEMSLVANALNMKTVVPGMLGPVAGEVREVLHLFDFERLWDGTTPFVDYILGAEPGGGVFTVGYSNNDYQRFMMNYYKMG